MTIRASLSEYACTAATLLALLSGAGTALGQQEIRLEQRIDPSTDISLGVVQTAPYENDLSSTEQGTTPLYDAFDYHEWRLKERREAIHDTKFEFNLRTYFIDRNQFSGIEQEAWAIGGWAGMKTGYFLDHIAFGVTGYTSVPLYAPDDRDGTLLLKPGQEGYAVLGEAYADIRIIDGLNLYIGRKGIDTPFINRNDTRMTPNTFELIVLQGRVEFDEPSTATPTASSKDPVEPPKKDVPVLKYGIGYFDEIKERNADHFVPMSIDAGATVDRGVYAAGAVYEVGKCSIGAIDYYSQDIINIGYAEGKMELPFSADFRPRLASQFVDQRSVGDELLQGDFFFVQQFGLKAELPIQKALFTAAYTWATNGDTNLRAPWSGYPGYTSVQVQDFNRAGENAFMIRAAYEFPWDGLSAYALAVFGTDPSGAGQFRQDEYDANLQWAPTKGCLKGLSLRFRYAVVEQHGGDVENLTDFRAICNYVIKF